LNLKKKSVIYHNLSKTDINLYPLYLKASVAMPIYNKSVGIKGESYFDGAMVDNIPVYPLLKHTIDYIICIYFDSCCYTFEDSYFNNKFIKITFPTNRVLFDSLVLNKGSIDKMISDGYSKTVHVLNDVFKNGKEDLQYILKTIEYYNERQNNNKLRITGDFLVSNLNKIALHFTKRKINI
jgi:predicted acylesterase/phospholipase RssA